MPPRKSIFEINCMSAEELLRDMYLRIVGDGTPDNPGLDKRVDRLEEQSRRRLSALQLVLYGPLCGIAGVAFDHLLQLILK
jgi:hypothetical protein